MANITNTGSYASALANSTLASVASTAGTYIHSSVNQAFNSAATTQTGDSLGSFLTSRIALGTLALGTVGVLCALPRTRPLVTGLVNGALQGFNYVCPTKAKKGIAAAVAASALMVGLPATLALGTAVGVGKLVKLVYDYRNAPVVVPVVVPVVDPFAALPVHNPVRTLVPLTKTAKKPQPIPAALPQIPLVNHNGIVAASLRMIEGDKLLREKLPTAIESRLCENDLFGARGVNNLAQLNPEKTAALLAITTELRKARIDDTGLDTLRTNLVLLGDCRKLNVGVVPMNRPNVDKIHELSVLLELRHYFQQGAAAPAAVDVAGLYGALRLLKPDLFPEQMGAAKAEIIIPTLTRLMEEDPLDGPSHAYQYRVHDDQVITFDTPPKRISYTRSLDLDQKEPLFLRMVVKTGADDTTAYEMTGYLCAQLDHAVAYVRSERTWVQCDNLRAPNALNPSMGQNRKVDKLLNMPEATLMMTRKTTKTAAEKLKEWLAS